MSFDFKNKSVVITGAAGGLGSAMAKSFIEGGAKVAVCDLKGAIAKAEELSASGEAYGFEFDITDREATREAFKKISEALSGIDILVNNAGINVGPDERKTVESFSDKWWDMINGVDLDGTYNCTKAALEYMRDGGSIINVSSIVGMIPLRNQCAFTAAKAGVINFTKAIALELAPRGIRANCVCPGTIGIEVTNQLWKDDAKMTALLSHIPMARQGRPSEIAAAVAFLASDMATYITGATLPVDGGWTAGGYARNF